MKKILFFAIILSFLFASCKEKNDDSAIEVTLELTSATLIVGDTLLLKATVSPNDVVNKKVGWVSYSPNVATVDEGEVIAVSPGTAMIVVFTEEHNKTANCTITVNNAENLYCNKLTPGWGVSLGEVGFATTHEWTITNGTITQIWSDAVRADSCSKNAFAGGSMSNHNSDCRSNPDRKGDLFSWCAVYRFQNQLCPKPWRVPTDQDFADLDIVLRGSGNVRDFYTDTVIRNKYLDTWGGAYAGYCGSNGVLSGQGSIAHYWSQSEQQSATSGFYLYLSSNGLIHPQHWLNKNFGLSLRCVRDAE
jgi:uncharacterized protein (TIGR02145 family)